MNEFFENSVYKYQKILLLIPVVGAFSNEDSFIFDQLIAADKQVKDPISVTWGLEYSSVFLMYPE